MTKREREILELICQGKRNQEIADALFITLQTVKDHNYRIFKKLGVKTRVQAANRIRRNTTGRSKQFTLMEPRDEVFAVIYLL